MIRASLCKVTALRNSKMGFAPDNSAFAFNDRHFGDVLNMDTQHILLQPQPLVVSARLVPLICNLHPFGGSRQAVEVRRVFSEGPRKSGLQQMLYLGISAIVVTRNPSKSVNGFLSSFATLFIGYPHKFHRIVPPATAASGQFRCASVATYLLAS
jgi:hypothetical protein